MNEHVDGSWSVRGTPIHRPGSVFFWWHPRRSILKRFIQDFETDEFAVLKFVDQTVGKADLEVLGDRKRLFDRFGIFFEGNQELSHGTCPILVIIHNRLRHLEDPDVTPFIVNLPGFGRENGNQLRFVFSAIPHSTGYGGRFHRKRSTASGSARPGVRELKTDSDVYCQGQDQEKEEERGKNRLVSLRKIETEAEPPAIVANVFTAIAEALILAVESR